MTKIITVDSFNFVGTNFRGLGKKAFRGIVKACSLYVNFSLSIPAFPYLLPKYSVVRKATVITNQGYIVQQYTKCGWSFYKFLTNPLWHDFSLCYHFTSIKLGLEIFNVTAFWINWNITNIFFIVYCKMFWCFRSILLFWFLLCMCIYVCKQMSDT
jgi:hypothetical protein